MSIFLLFDWTKGIQHFQSHKSPLSLHTKPISTIIITFQIPRLPMNCSPTYTVFKTSNQSSTYQNFNSSPLTYSRKNYVCIIMRSTKKLGNIMEKWMNKRKGHFVVYAKEGKRFVVPLYYLNHPIFRVLLDMAEEEFGSMVHGPLQVPCEEELMDYIICLLRKSPPEEVERAVVHHIL